MTHPIGTELLLYNSLTHKKEVFEAFDPPKVGMYSCGFTVYDHTHIGHIKKYVGDDLLRRVLEFNGYEVTHVQNVTDVGHLVSDADEGEDKMEKGAKKYGLTIEQIARKFEKEFYNALDDVNVLKPQIIERAADKKCIQYQISLIEELVEKGFAYVTENAVYFDVSKLPQYNPFSKQPLEDKIKGSREDVIVDPNKRNAADFALWVFTKGEHANHIMHWKSPWGDGFPGWHIECSAISMKNLGDKIDIHTGGIDHLEIHHPNEIAQNYGVTGHEVVKYWVHHNFLTVNGRKMSKSLSNFYTILDIKERGFSPLVLRYFILGTHYRKQINFTWDALYSAQNAYDKLIQITANLLAECEDGTCKPYAGNILENKYYIDFLSAINDDINIPNALGVMWTMLDDYEVKSPLKKALLDKFDEVLGLKIIEKGSDFNKNKDIGIQIGDLKIVSSIKIPEEVIDLINKREEYRSKKEWDKSDEVRDEIEKMGYELEDYSESIKIKRK